MDYSKVLSKTIVETQKSGIRKYFDLLDGMTDVVGLTIGQPDFVTPWHIREAGIESLEKGKTYYTSNAGTLELRQEIDTYLNRRFGLHYEPETEIIVTVGGSEAIDIALRSVLEPGDEIIVPTPSFVCYAPLARMAGGTPVILETTAKDRFKLSPEALKAAITPRTKMLVLPYPNNPTGAIMTKEELEDIAEVLRDTNILVLSDEIYAEMTYGRKHVSFASLEGMKERTIIVSGFSKAYAMTGWRLGYACAPKELIKQMTKIHQFAIMCAPTISQYAAVEALKNGDKDVEEMRQAYNQRRRFLMDSFKKMGLDCFEPFGAFYVFPCIKEFGMTSEEFATKFLQEEKVAIVPGTAFGDCGEGFLRISYAYSLENLKEAIGRLERFITKLRNQRQN